MTPVSSKAASRRAEGSLSASDSSARGPSLPLLRSEELFRRSREIMIEHGGAYYRLRLTHSNKLILTK
jgi:hemin uptake protein HemP